MRSLRSLGLLTLGLLMLIPVLATPLHAQWRSAPRFEVLDRGLPIEPAVLQGMALDPTPGSEITGESNSNLLTTFAFASAGSLVGLAAGAGLGHTYYQATGCCRRGDDPGLSSLLWGMAIGSTTGSAMGAVFAGGRTWGGSFLGSTIGVATGLLAANAGDRLGVPEGGGVLLYSLMQGFSTAVISAVRR